MAICKLRSALITEENKDYFNGDENNNPFKLKKYYIRLEKLGHVERALALGYRALSLFFIILVELATVKKVY